MVARLGAVGLVLALAVVHASPTAEIVCPTNRTLPGLERFIAHGVDLLRFDLFPERHVRHHRSPLFEFTCTRGRRWSSTAHPETVYAVPDQVQAVAALPVGPVEFVNVRTEMFHSAYDLLREWQRVVGVEQETPVGDGSFASAARFAETVRRLHPQRDLKLAETSVNIPLVEIDLREPSSLKLSRAFQARIAALPSSYAQNPRPYRELLTKFGTHYFEGGKFGGALVDRAWIDGSYVRSVDRRQVVANLKKQFNQIFHVGESPEIEQAKRRHFQHHTTQQRFAYGGEPNFMFDYNILANRTTDYLPRWIDTVRRSPWLLSGRLVSIDHLVTDATIRAQLRKAIKARLTPRSRAAAFLGSPASVDSDSIDLIAARLANSTRVSTAAPSIADPNPYPCPNLPDEEWDLMWTLSQQLVKDGCPAIDVKHGQSNPQVCGKLRYFYTADFTGLAEIIYRVQ